MAVVASRHTAPTTCNHTSPLSTLHPHSETEAGVVAIFEGLAYPIRCKVRLALCEE